MSRKWLALAAAALALTLVAATFDTAEAHRRGGMWRGGGSGHFHGFRGGHFHGFRGHRHFGHHHHRRRHFHPGFIIGAPLAYGAYYYGSGYGSCRWLRHRALETGSRYWWSRYHDCINGYY